MKLAFLIMILITCSIVAAAVVDLDVDGIPDNNDKCPNSASDIVDRSGCDCAQKLSPDCDSSVITCCEVACQSEVESTTGVTAFCVQHTSTPDQILIGETSLGSLGTLIGSGTYTVDGNMITMLTGTGSVQGSGTTFTLLPNSFANMGSGLFFTLGSGSTSNSNSGSVGSQQLLSGGGLIDFSSLFNNGDEMNIDSENILSMMQTIREMIIPFAQAFYQFADNLPYNAQYSGRDIGDVLLQTNPNPGTFTYIAAGLTPEIYLYPKTDAFIKIQVMSPISLSLPLYDDYWYVYANIDSLIDGKYEYLYYEYSRDISYEFIAGEWVTDNIALWFDTTLPQIGLNPTESKNYRTIWLDRLPEVPYYKIQMVDPSWLESKRPISIEPTPNTIIRMTLIFTPLQTLFHEHPPIIAQPKRTGFVVVETGGELI